MRTHNDHNLSKSSLANRAERVSVSLETKVVRWQFRNMNTQVAETGVRFLGNETEEVRWQFLNMNTQVAEPWA